MYANYPDRYKSNNGKFALFTLKEIVKVEIITKDQKSNAQRWATSTAVVPGKSPIVGYIHRSVITDPIGNERDWYANIGNGIPMFEVLDETVKVVDPDVSQYSINIFLQYTTKYIAVGAKIQKMFGYSVCGRTPPRKSPIPPYPVTRGQLDMVVWEIYVEELQ